MKKIYTIITLLVVLMASSCDKNVIEYNATSIDENTQSQIRFVYALNTLAAGAPNITRLKYNGVTVSEVSTAVGAFLPGTAKYHVVPKGPLAINTYTGTTKDVAQYTRSITIQQGRWNAFVHSLTADPLMLQVPNVLPTVLWDPWVDTACTIQFVNLLYDAAGTAGYGSLTLKVRRGTSSANYTYTTIGTAAFGAATELVKFKFLKANTSVGGTESSLAFVLYNSDATVFKTFSTGTTLADYASTGWSLTKGRNYVVFLNGLKGSSSTTQRVALSSITLN